MNVKKSLFWLFFCVFLCLTSIATGKDIEFSRSFLGIYKKTKQYYPELKRYADEYEVDINLVIAVAMYESGGNNTLTSHAGAHGLMQVMPSTKKYMKVDGYIEAGVKYLSYLKRKFEKVLLRRNGEVSISNLNSLIIMAYNGGPARAEKGLIKIETFQYLKGVSLFFNLLSQKSYQIDELTKNLEILTLKKSLSWEELSKRLGISVLELRLYNPFLAGFFYKKKIPEGEVFVYPKNSIAVIAERIADEAEGLGVFYTVRHGDILHYLSHAFGISYKDIRNREGLLLWGSLQPGIKIDVTDSLFLNE